MYVAAFNTPKDSAWRWRIVNYAGEILEESRDSFSTIAAAVASGTERLVSLNIVDRSAPAIDWRSTSYLRSHPRSRNSQRATGS